MVILAATSPVPMPEPLQGAEPPARLKRRDRRLARALIRGEPDAMAMMMELHGRALLGCILGVVGEQALAQDVLQQVLLEIWQRSTSYDPTRSGVLTWALMISRSRAVDELRRRVPEPVDPAVAAAVEIDGVDESDQLLERWRVAELLRRLPTDESSLLRMRFYEGFTQAEIAERTGIPVGTVKTRMVNGLTQLRGLLEHEGADHGV
jgi:RNA polymerase sigma-70 factor (ECF subfamily)